MSNYGKIYEVNATTGVVNAYPIVYSNPDYYLCKVYGCNDVLRFYRHWDRCGAWHDAIYSIEDFKKALSDTTHYSQAKYYVFEPPHVHFNFKEACKFNKRSMLAYLHREQERDEESYRAWEESMDKYQKQIVDLYNNFDVAKEKRDMVGQRMKERENTMNQLQIEIDLTGE